MELKEQYLDEIKSSIPKRYGRDCPSGGWVSLPSSAHGRIVEAKIHAEKDLTVVDHPD